MSYNYTGNLLMVANYPSDTSYAWWLIEHLWKTLAEHFMQAGYKTYLAYPKITFLTQTITKAPIELVELSISCYCPKHAARIYKFLIEKKISVIYFTDQCFFSYQYAIMRSFGVKHIIVHDHTDGDRPPVYGIKRSLKAIRNRMAYFTADRVLCVSELMRQRSILNARFPANKCFVVKNGISPISCVPERRNLVRESLGISPSSFLIITTGRAHPSKRFNFIIECANLLRRISLGFNIIFLLVGDGPIMPELRAMVRHLCLEDSVRILGFRSDVRDLLCASDLAIHASLVEGFSLSIIEYMSAGLPVLVPDIPSVKQAIVHNKTGFVYPMNDANTVVYYIQMLINDTKHRLAMGHSAKAEADSNYTLELCTNHFIAAIEADY